MEGNEGCGYESEEEVSAAEEDVKAEEGAEAEEEEGETTMMVEGRVMGD